MSDRGYLPLKEAAEWAGVSPKTLIRWLQRGLPRYQAGPREKVLIRLSDIDLFLTRLQSAPAPLDQMVTEVLTEIQSNR
jgi:predicted site-specific integrase-resolvase